MSPATQVGVKPAAAPRRPRSAGTIQGRECTVRSLPSKPSCCEAGTARKGVRPSSPAAPRIADGAREPEVSGLEVTRALKVVSAGEEGAFDDLVDLVYGHLERLARGQLRRLRFGRTLDTRALVHETYLKMLNQGPVQWKDRQHFFAVTSRAMRQILVDHARRRSAQKRGGGGEPIELEEHHLLIDGEASGLVLQLDMALDELATIDAALRQVVEHRFFAGLSELETAEAMGISLRSVQRLWSRARIWLRSELDGPGR